MSIERWYKYIYLHGRTAYVALEHYRGREVAVIRWTYLLAGKVMPDRRGISFPCDSVEEVIGALQELILARDGGLPPTDDEIDDPEAPGAREER